MPAGNIIVIGGKNDAPGFQLVPDGHGGWKIKRIPGWNPEQMADLAHSLEIIGEASQLKTAGVAEQVINSVGALVQKQLGEHAGGGSVVVLRG